MKTFDFEQSPRNQYVRAWLERNRDKPISEEVFVAKMKALREHSHGMHRSKRYAPSALKSEYRKLKNVFGFFVAPHH